jgi:hypothetical protein
MRGLLLVAPCVCLALAGCMRAATKVKAIAPPVLEKGWTEHKSDAHHFSIGLPPGWVNFDMSSPEAKAAFDQVSRANPGLAAQIEKARTNPDLVLNVGDNASVDSGFMNSLNVIHKSGIRLGTLNESAIASFRKGLESSLPQGAQVSFVKQVELPIGPALESRVLLGIAVPGGGNLQVVSKSYFIPNGDESFNVTFSTLQDREAKLSPLFKKAVDTFRVRS